MASPDTDTDTEDQATTEDQGGDQEFQPAGNSVIRWQSAPTDTVAADQPAEEPAQPAEEPQFQPAGNSVIKWQQPSPQSGDGRTADTGAPAQSQMAEMFPSYFGTSTAAAADTGAPAPAAAAGASQEPSITNQARYYTPYDGTRPIDAIILHSSDGRTVQGDVNTLTGGDPDHKVSAHYYTTEDGQSLHFVNDNDVAYHAGATSGKLANYNNENTIGIEQQHVDGEPWKDAQVRGTARTVADLLRRYPNLDIDHVLGHSDVAPERKQDPLNFPWADFRKYVAQDLGQGAAAPSAAAPAQSAAAAQPPSQLAEMFPSQYGTPASVSAEDRPPEAQPVPGGPVPRARPAAQQANGLYDYENPQDFVTGQATMFGDKADIANGQDSGVGAPRLGGLPTTDIYGVAVPEWVLRSRLGNSPAAWRKARMDVVDPSSGNRLRVPIVDLGPSSAQEEKGIVADLTPGVDKFFNNQGGGKNLMFNLVKNAGPDVNSNTPEWNNEQAAIASGVDVGQTAKAAQTYPAKQRGGGAAPATTVPWTVQWLTDAEVEGARQATQQQKLEALPDEMATLNNLQQQNQNPAAMINTLQQPIKGVSDDTRNEYLANYKQQVTKEAQQFYNEPDPDKALAKATSSVGPVEFIGEALRKVLPNFGKTDVGLASMFDTAAENNLGNFFNVVAPGTSPDAKANFIKELQALPDKQARMDHINAMIAMLPPEQQVAIDPMRLADAVDTVANPQYQAQRQQAIQAKQDWISKSLETDPRFKGTPADTITQNLGALPKNVLEAMLPAGIRETVFYAEIYGDTKDDIRRNNPNMSAAQVNERANYSTIAQLLPQEVLGAAVGGKLGPLVEGIGNPWLRAGSRALVDTAVASAGAVGQQATANVFAGRPATEGLEQAGISGAIQGGIPGLVHGVGELRRPVETRAEAPPPSEAQPTEPQQPPPARGEVPPTEPPPSGEAQPPREQPAPVVGKPAGEESYVDPDRVTKRVASDEIHWVPADEVDQRWNTPDNKDFYIPPGGTENTIGQRYPNAMTDVKGESPMHAPEASVGDDGSVQFIDGRHRFAAMRDLGHTQVPLALDAESVKNARATGLVMPQAQEPPPPAETGGVTGLKNIGEMGKGISAGMRDMLWEKFQRGETTEAGGPSNILLAAAREKAAGRINNRADFEALIDAYGRHLAGKGQVPPHAEKPPNALPTEPAPLEQGTDKYVSSIANRFVQPKVEAGQIGEIAPGQGYSTKDLIAAGLKMSPEQVTQHMSDLMQGVGDPKAQAAAIRAEEARLSQRSAQASKIAEANPNDVQARIQADNAFKDLTDFHNGPVAKLKNNWHASGMAMQGDIPVDLTTYNGIREAWLRDTGKPPTPEQEPVIRNTAARVKGAMDAENAAMSKLGQAITESSKMKKFPSADDVRTRIMERMKVEPCRT